MQLTIFENEVVEQKTEATKPVNVSVIPTVLRPVMDFETGSWEIHFMSKNGWQPLYSNNFKYQSFIDCQAEIMILIKNNPRTFKHSKRQSIPAGGDFNH